jgi:hypothetical protein
MKNLITKLLGKNAGQGKTPVATAVVFTQTKTLAPKRLQKITDIVDDEAVQDHIGKFKIEGELLVDAVSKYGEYEYELENGSPAVLKEVSVLAEKTISLCTSMVIYAKTPYTKYREELEYLLNRKSREERENEFLDQNIETINREISEAEKPLLEIKSKEYEAKQARDKKDEAKSKRSKISKEKYGGHPPTKRAVSKWVYGGFISLLAPTETMLNSGALDTIESDLQTWFILPTALTITGMIAMAAHFLGVFIANKSSRGLIAITVTSSILMLGIIFFLRANGIQSAFVLTFINVAAFLLMTGLSYLRHKDDAYFKADQAYLKWSESESDLYQEIATITKTAEDDKSAIYDKWKVEAATTVKKEVEPLKLEILRLEREEELFDNYLKTKILDPLHAMRQDFLTRAEINYVKARMDNKLPVWEHVVKAKPEEESVEEDIETYEAEIDVDENFTFNEHYRANGFNHGDDIKKGFYTLLMIVSFFGVTSCVTDRKEEVPPEHIEMIVVNDASISKKDSVAIPTSEQQLAFMMDVIGFEPYQDYLSVTRDQVRLQVTFIGDTSFPPVKTVELNEGVPIWKMVKSKRREEQKVFIEDALAAITEYAPPQGLPSSHVFDCLCQVIPPLVASDASQKKVLMISDLLEYSDAENFYTLYKRMPGEFESIKDHLEDYCPALKDLSFEGIDFTAVYLPDEDRDKATRNARKFWEMYINSKDGKIDFKANLPDVKPQIARH